MTIDGARHTRSTMINIARRKQRPGSGSAYAMLSRRTADVKWLDLTDVLGPVPWAVIGAVATRHYMPERMTKDLDVAIVALDATVVRHRLSLAGFSYQSELSIGGSHWLSPDGLELDIIEGTESWWPQALEEARQNRDLQGLPVLPLPYLAFTKFKAGRLQDIADLSRMLGQASPVALESVRIFFSQHFAPTDLADLEDLIILGQLEMQTPPGH